MEQEEDETIDNLVDTLYMGHLDNSKQQYLAQKPGDRLKSVMPVTSFVFEYFLFNSIYQVDWESSCRDSHLQYNSQSMSEMEQQKKLLGHLKERLDKSPLTIYHAFEPLLFLGDLSGDWTRVAPDARISLTKGTKFFEGLTNLQNTLRAHSAMNTDAAFEHLLPAIRFIYNVRNSIFHGSKGLGETYDPKQRQRIRVYETLLRGVTSLFFLSRGKSEVGSDYSECPISFYPSQARTFDEAIDGNIVWKLRTDRLMKTGDTRLIREFRAKAPAPDTPPSEGSALFYPSAGWDLITPILLGLPYCRRFYFYDNSTALRNRERNTCSPAVQKRYEAIKRGLSRLGISSEIVHSERDLLSESPCLRFDYAEVTREVCLICTDNADFLKTSVDLRFFFHRGDSTGEGGSNQNWESKLLPELRRRIPPGSDCILLSDGHPGGLGREALAGSEILYTPFLERGRPYYLGRIRGN